MFPSAYDRDNPTTGPPSSDVLRFLAKLREEPPEDEGSSADEGVGEDVDRRCSSAQAVPPANSATVSHLLHQAVGPSRLGGIHRAQFGYVSLNGS